MDLFKKIVQAGQNLLKSDSKNPLGVDKEFIELLTNYFELISSVDSQMPSAIVRYIVDDVDDGILLKLQGSVDAATKLGYIGTWQQTQGPLEKRAKMFKYSVGKEIPAQIWYRLAQVSSSLHQAGRGYSVTKPNGWPDWLVQLLIDSQNNCTWNMGGLEEILVVANLPGDIFVAPFISGDDRHIFHWGRYGAKFQGAPGQKEYMQKYSALVRSTLQTLQDNDKRVSAVGLLNGLDFDCTSIMDMLIEMATGSAKTLREAAIPLIKKQGQEARPLLESVLRDGDASARNEAVRLMGMLYKSDCQSLLEEHMKIEKSERVKQSIQNLFASTQASAAAEATPIELPPLQVELGVVALPPLFREKLTACYNSDYDANMRFYMQQLKVWASPDRPKWTTEPRKPDAATEQFLAYILRFIEQGGEYDMKTYGKWIRYAQSELNEVVKLPGLKLIHFARLMFALNIVRLQGGRGGLWISNQGLLQNFRNSSGQDFGLREMDAAFATLPGFSSGLIGISYLNNTSKWHSFWDGPPPSIWPLFAEQPQTLHEAFQPAQGYYVQNMRVNAFRTLAAFPHVPGEFLPILWELALGETKSERYLAQEALHTVHDRVERIKGALGDGRQTVRAAAAEWLGKLGDNSAVEPLKAAFVKEKSEVTKGTIMHALDELGASVDEFLDRDKLLEEAKSGMAKKLPKGMEWVPLDGLPKVHWQDTGKQVDVKIVQWWIVQCIQQKSPTCGPLLKRYLSMCKPQDAVNLSKFALSSWIGRDTAVLSVEDCAARAKDCADKQWAQYGAHTWFTDRYKGNKENLYKENLNNLQNQCLYSAIEQKGMLALACVAGDGDSVKLCEKFIRKFYGTRAAQCRCLIEVLSWIENPLALQTMLSIANRFRTKSIKEMAQEHVQAIADRKGWTIDELADRTIPDGGFARPVNEDNEPIGDEAVLELDYGARQFQSRLNDELEPVIFVKGETKPIKALPASGKNDDEEKAKQAKKQFSDAKKVVKEVVKRQTERLYEAMCTQRSWTFADWKLYLAAHPVVGRLCVRLVWAAFSAVDNGGKPEFLGCFRPLEDGSLTNEKDENVTLPENATIVLAHSCNTSKELGEAWLKHLKDYDVTALFQQFGRGTYELPEKSQKATDVLDFEGHMLTTFKLRGKATKLGFVRGEVEDGGCFCVYRKSFTSLSLQAVIEFSGSYVPEEDIPAALTNLYFERIPEGDKQQSYWNAQKVPLGTVPAVLLSECYNDVKQVAAEGSGFDPEWKKKGLW